MSGSAGNTGDWLLAAVKKNPEGLLLLAAGAVLLMRKAGGMGSTNAWSAIRPFRKRQFCQGRDRREGIRGGARILPQTLLNGRSKRSDRLRLRRPNMPNRHGAQFRDSRSGSWIRPSPRSKAQ